MPNCDSIFISQPQQLTSITLWMTVCCRSRAYSNSCGSGSDMLNNHRYMSYTDVNIVLDMLHQGSPKTSQVKSNRLKYLNAAVENYLRRTYLEDLLGKGVTNSIMSCFARNNCAAVLRLFTYLATRTHRDAIWRSQAN